MVLEMLTGAALLAIGWAAGRFISGRRRAHVCECGHKRAFHDPSTGRCHDRTLIAGVWDEERRRHVDSLVPCECRQYDGPTPPPAVQKPEVTS